MRRLALVPLALVLALLLACVHASDACAHASLLKAEPADGAVIPAPPHALSLTFNEPVSLISVHLIGPDGETVALGQASVLNATVTVPAPARWQSGTHLLSWRVISADGHPVGGTVTFSIGAPSARPLDAAPSQGDPAVRALLWAAKLLLYIGLFVGVGGAFFRAWIAAPSACPGKVDTGFPARTCANARIESVSRFDPIGVRSDAPPSGPLIAALLVGLLGAVASLGLQGLDALARPLSALAERAAWDAGAATSYGLTAITAAVALLAGLSSLRTKAERAARATSLVGVFALGLALALSGHASTAAPTFISRPVVFAHVVSVAFWIGALFPLYVYVRHVYARNGYVRGSPRPADALARFSRVIPIPIALLVASGAWLAIVQLGRVDALWTTSYGLVLAGKLAAVAVLLGLGVANRYWLVPKFSAGDKAAARPFAISLACELAIALAILGLVALWRFTPPPRALAVNAPISLHVHGEKAMAQIDIERADGGNARADVLVLDGAFQPLAVKEVTLVLANPAAGIEPIRRIATRAGAATDSSNWRVDDLRIPVAGRWSLRVELLVSDFDKLMIEDVVALPRLP